MKKILSVLLTLAFLAQGTAVVMADGNLTLSGTTKINVENTDTCFAKATENEKTSGNFGLQFKAGASDWLEVSQSLNDSAVAGGQYIISVKVKPVSGRIWFRIGWDDTGWLATHQSEFATDLGNGWIQLTKEVTLTENQTNILFHNDGATEMYVDDISLKQAGSSTELVPDGGFEEVTVAGAHEHSYDEYETDGAENHKKICECGDEITEPHSWNGGFVTTLPTTEATGIKTYTCTGCGETYTEIVDKLEAAEDIPDEDLTLSSTTTLNEENTEVKFAKVTDNEKAGGNYSLHIKSNADGWLEVSQRLTENAVSGGTYIMSAAVKVVTGKVWFRLGWDNDAWMVSNQENTDIGNGWIRLTKEVAVAGNEGDINTFLFHNDGATELYIDDISLKAVGSDTELVPDGGFEEVTVAGDEPPVITPDEPADDIPDSWLKLSDKTSVSLDDENYYAVATDDVKRSGNYSLYFKAGTDAELKVTQNFAEGLEAGEYIITAYTKSVSGRLWFRIYNDEDNAWVATHANQELQPDGWTKHEKTVTVNGSGNTYLFFHNDTSGGTAEFYIDDISLVKAGGTENLLPDGSFEDVTIVEPDPNDYEDYELSKLTLKKGTEIADKLIDEGEYTVSVSVKNNKVPNEMPFELLVAVFDENGMMTELCKDTASLSASALGAKPTELSAAFTIGAGYSVEAYLIDNRQNVNLYTFDGEYIYETWTQNE